MPAGRFRSPAGIGTTAVLRTRAPDPCCGPACRVAVVNALEHWRSALRSWAIPEEILAAAPESPYGFPTELFRRRAERAAESEPTPTTLRALDALPAGGSVLDVGVGAGSTSLALASRASLIVGVDVSQDMLAAFRETAQAAGVAARTVHGIWPDVASEVEPADVVVCGHVFYNVQDLEPFVHQLTAHARRRVVVELTGHHPLAWMNDLWQRFHTLDRPAGPTADDAERALLELGLDPGRARLEAPGSGGFDRREDAVALVRRRLCLPPDRDAEIAEALGGRLAERDGLWSAGPIVQAVETLWWDR